MKSFIRHFAYYSSISFWIYAGYWLIKFTLNPQINGAAAVSESLGSALPYALALLLVSCFAFFMTFFERVSNGEERNPHHTFHLFGVLVLLSLVLAWACSPLFATKVLNLSSLFQGVGLLAALVFGVSYLLTMLEHVSDFFSYEVVEVISRVQYKLAKSKHTTSVN